MTSRLGRSRRRSPDAPGVRFLSRYPVVLVVLTSAGFFGVAYAFAVTLAGSWSYIHGAKAAAVVVGVVAGITFGGLHYVGWRRPPAGPGRFSSPAPGGRRRARSPPTLRSPSHNPADAPFWCAPTCVGAARTSSSEFTTTSKGSRHCSTPALTGRRHSKAQESAVCGCSLPALFRATRRKSFSGPPCGQ